MWRIMDMNENKLLDQREENNEIPIEDVKFRESDGIGERIDKFMSQKVSDDRSGL